MKKYLVLTVCVALLAVVPANASIKWGLKAGVNISSIGDISGGLNKDNYTGFLVGPTTEFTLPLIGLGMDASLLYSQTGFKLEDETFKTGSLLIPVNLKYKLSFMDLVGAYLAFGPYISFKLYDDNDDLDIPGLNDLKAESFGAGLNFGFGVEFLSKIQVGANYQLGLTEDYKAGLFDDPGKTRVWSIAATYFF